MLKTPLNSFECNSKLFETLNSGFSHYFCVDNRNIIRNSSSKKFVFNMPLFYQQDINENTKLAIWKIEEDEDFFKDKLSVDSNIIHTKKRTEHHAGRYLLTYLYPEFPFHKILISESNKPFLQNQEFQFSISHTSNFAAAIVSKSNNVGIDIEITDERVMKVAHKFLSDHEMAIFSLNNRNNLNSSISSRDKNYNVNDYYQIKLLTTLWSCKETIYKWWGNGKVDFKKMIAIDYFKLEKTGKIESVFTESGSSRISNLLIDYKIFEDLCLTFTYL